MTILSHETRTKRSTRITLIEVAILGTLYAIAIYLEWHIIATCIASVMWLSIGLHYGRTTPPAVRAEEDRILAKSITYPQFQTLWTEEFSTDNGFCIICDNDGIIDTTGRVHERSGLPSGGRAWCICPNGRQLKRKSGLAKPPEVMA